MNAYDIHALSGAYAVDALDPTEKAEFERHLASCSACQAEVASLRETAAVLAETAESDPPPALRDRVVAEIKTVRPLPPPAPKVRSLPVRRRLMALAAAAAVLAVAGVGTIVWQQTTSTDQAPSTTDRVLQAADATRVNVDLPGEASASVIRSVSEGKAVIVTRNMPAPPAGRVYELWLQTRDGTMVPAGLMSKAGNTTFLLEGDATDSTAAGITIEPEGGSESPTTEPIALFDFEQTT